MQPENNSFIRKYELQFISKAARYVPKRVGTKTLTLLALLCSPIIFIGYMITPTYRIGLIVSSIFIFLQWLFDCLDGTIGRMRNEGFVKWGFYMDHLFDFIFLSSIILGLAYLFRESSLEIVAVYFFAATLMFSFSLFYSVDKKENFKVSYLFVSPTEGRIAAIVLNISLLVFWNFSQAIIRTTAIVSIIFLLVLLSYKIFDDQRYLDRLDRKNR